MEEKIVHAPACHWAAVSPSSIASMAAAIASTERALVRTTPRNDLGREACCVGNRGEERSAAIYWMMRQGTERIS